MRKEHGQQLILGKKLTCNTKKRSLMKCQMSSSKGQKHRDKRKQLKMWIKIDTQEGKKDSSDSYNITLILGIII